MADTMTKKHRLVLLFTDSNLYTTISCECGARCGKVVTGTRIPEILEIYREHIQEEINEQK